jgi:hypothetical protein
MNLHTYDDEFRLRRSDFFRDADQWRRVKTARSRGTSDSQTESFTATLRQSSQLVKDAMQTVRTWTSRSPKPQQQCC